ncbi:hypothetical protein K435DRAFT_795262 [Dendrothele bispora CBS 962.96]|uniref:DUF6532 domain-containing protein n=1 Tax=Dendrothele bispora (strain CBS 962.96) TaxID=1314807 RepID=A0A4S8MAK4_DENBC|nr:hypothetical protein K435DRAFT_795262 [Dendrothele bispora CBS 962.96]
MANVAVANPFSEDLLRKGLGDWFSLVFVLATLLTGLAGLATHCIAMDRIDWKDKHVALVLSAYDFTAEQKTRNAAQDLSNSMQLHFGLKDNGDIDPVNPFHHPGLVQFITAAFFSRGIRSWYDIVAEYKSSLFVSLIESKSNELELPQSMVAISCAVIYAILQDHAYSKCEKFPPPNLDAVQNCYMDKCLTFPCIS